MACETHLSRVECVTAGRSGRLSGFVVVRAGGNPDRPLSRAAESSRRSKDGAAPDLHEGIRFTWMRNEMHDRSPGWPF